jgi:predicted amidohydrolase
MSTLTIAAVQSSSTKGDLAANVGHHLSLVRAAHRHGADLVVFPELSLTGYEPTLAADVAVHPDDPRLRELQDQATELQVVILAGCPIRSTGEKPFLGMLIFQPGASVAVYRKRFVHSSELPYFLASHDSVVLPVEGVPVGLAICADISNPAHAADAARQGARVYAAGVAKTPDDMDRANANMQAHARTHRMLALMANHASATGGLPTGGRSAVWDESGSLLACAAAEGEQLVVACQREDGWTATAIGL